MYLNILKKDLKRKKAMNIILLLFIILATMFVSSSVNNIINVTVALDNYFEMANAPDYLLATMNKAFTVDIDETVRSAEAVDSYVTEDILYLTASDISFEDEDIEVETGTHLLHSDIGMNYFLSDGSILDHVELGKLYITESRAKTLGVKVGDKLIIELDGVSRRFVLAGTIKDAVFGSSQLSITRYIISEEDFEYYLSGENVEMNYGGTLIYIDSSNMEKMQSQLKPLIENSVLTMDRAFMEFCYVFDMVVVGILLVVSIILIIIAFVVLRFTITFTLSEEFREIGVMKAIGISNFKIRGLYLVKYMGLSVVGAALGLVLSFPFGKMLMSVSSQSIIVGNKSPFLVNIFCAVLVIAVILLFCYGCTGKVKHMTPIDAIRNGQTGERFRKKSLMSLGKTKLPATSFLALNDIVSSPRRYSIISLTFFLCLSLMLILSATVSTMNSGSLATTFGWADCDLYLSNDKVVMEWMMEDGHENLKEYLDEMEQTLEENEIPAICYQELLFSFPVTFGENECNITIYHGTGTTMDMYEYTAGVAPQYTNEIAITRIAADKLEANIGDTVTIKTIDGEKEYIITAYFQCMNSQGIGIRLHSDEYLNNVQAIGGVNSQIMFTDNPDSEEIERRLEVIRRLFPDCEKVETCAEYTADLLGVAEVLASVKSLIAILTVVLTALNTVLMERSFIAKEEGEIALMKAVGMRNGKIYAYHTLRFLFVGMIAVIIGEIFAMPLTHLCIDPVFKMMGMEIAVDYVINPVEMYLVFPLVILVTTTISAFLTSLYTRKIKSSDTANIE